MALPPLDAMGITPFGDFELRQAACAGPRRMRPPHQLAQELGGLLLRLLASADPGLDNAPPACVDAARRASSTGSRRTGRPPHRHARRAAHGTRGVPAARSLGRARRGCMRGGAARPIAITPRHGTTSVTHRRRPSSRRRWRRDRSSSPPRRLRARSATRTDARALACGACVPGLLLLPCSGGNGRSRQPPSAACRPRHLLTALTHHPVPRRNTGPAAAPESSPTEVEIAPPPEPMPAPMAPVRARRLLDAGRTGSRRTRRRSTRTRTRSSSTPASNGRRCCRRRSSSDGAVDEISTMRTRTARGAITRRFRPTASVSRTTPMSTARAVCTSRTGTALRRSA